MKRHQRVLVRMWMWSLVLVASLFIGAQAKVKKEPVDMDQAIKQATESRLPGEEHKALAPFIGKWTNVAHMWMKPGDKPSESTGTNENTWIMDGRFIRQDYKGEFNGQAFQGLGITGYDKVRAEYQSVWLDNFMTGLMYGTGSYDAKTKTVQVGGTFACPITGEKDHWYRYEWKTLDNDHYLYLSYSKDPDGNEFLSMAINFTRAK